MVIYVKALIYVIQIHREHYKEIKLENHMINNYYI